MKLMCAAGVILFIMLAGFPPFQFATKQDWWYQKLQTGRHALFWKAHCRQAFFSDEAKDFMNKILEPVPEERITVEQILQHAWFTGSVLSDSELRDELSNRKRSVQAEKKKEKEALAKKNARGSRGVRGAKRSDDRSIVLMGEDGLPVSLPEMDFSGAFVGQGAVNLGADLASLGLFGPARVSAEPPVFDEKNNIECYTSFMSLTSPSAVLSTLSEVFQSAGIKSSKPEPYELRASIMTQNIGSVDFIVRVYLASAEENAATVVQFRKLRGDVLQFHTLYDELLTEIVDLVYIPEDQE